MRPLKKVDTAAQPRRYYHIPGEYMDILLTLCESVDSSVKTNLEIKSSTYYWVQFEGPVNGVRQAKSRKSR